MKTQNPFKFGTIADGPYFTNRTNELRQMASLLNSQNHLIVIPIIRNNLDGLYGRY